MNTTASNDLVVETIAAALEELKECKLWSDVLRENVYVGSYEKFLQASILGAVNRQKDPKLWCDMERQVVVDGKRMRPDLWFIDADDDAWAKWMTPKLDLQQKLGLTRGMVEIKVAWINGWAKHSAALKYRAPTIAKDVLKIRAPAGRPWNRVPRFVLVCLAGVATGKKGIEESMTEAEAHLNQVMKTQGKVIPVKKIDLIENANMGNEEFLSARTLLYDARWFNEVK